MPAQAASDTMRGVCCPLFRTNPAMQLELAPIIKEIGRGIKGARHLDHDTARALFGAMLDGTVGELELGAVLIALRVKSESTDELLGFKHACDARITPVAVPADGPRCVVLPSYNGARRHANLMPLLALLLAREGVPVLIQGRHDFDSRANPFDLLAALDLPLAASPTDAGAALAAQRIACIDVEHLLPGLAELLALRPRMGVRTTAHTLAKLIDPCPGRSVRVVAVTHPEYLQRMGEFLRADHGPSMLLRGTEGEAYANPRRLPQLTLFDHGTARIGAEAAEGGAPPRDDFPDAPEVAANAELIRAMLDGQLPVPEPIITQVGLLAGLARQR